MPKCTYCGRDFEAHQGVTVVNSVSGYISYFCSRKCRIYTEMNRKRRKWSGKRVASTYEKK